MKKTRLKGNKPKVKNFTEAEAMQVAKLAMENQNLTHVQIDKLFRSFHSVTPNPWKIYRHLRPDKSNIPRKLRTPSVIKFTALMEDYIKVIHNVSEIIHGVVEFSDEGEDFQSFKAMSELKDKIDEWINEWMNPGSQPPS